MAGLVTNFIIGWFYWNFADENKYLKNSLILSAVGVVNYLFNQWLNSLLFNTQMSVNFLTILILVGFGFLWSKIMQFFRGRMNGWVSFTIVTTLISEAIIFAISFVIAFIFA